MKKAPMPEPVRYRDKRTQSGTEMLRGMPMAAASASMPMSSYEKRKGWTHCNRILGISTKEDGGTEEYVMYSSMKRLKMPPNTYSNSYNTYKPKYPMLMFLSNKKFNLKKIMILFYLWFEG
jgi:hypothetical protein